MKKLLFILLAVLAVGCADKTTKKLVETDPLAAQVLDFNFRWGESAKKLNERVPWLEEETFETRLSHLEDDILCGSIFNQSSLSLARYENVRVYARYVVLKDSGLVEASYAVSVEKSETLEAYVDMLKSTAMNHNGKNYAIKSYPNGDCYLWTKKDVIAAALSQNNHEKTVVLNFYDVHNKKYAYIATGLYKK